MTNARTIADSAGEATVLDVTAGTAAASKAVVLDASKNIATLGTVASGALTVTGASTITTADNTDTLTLVSTDTDANIAPVLNLSRNNNSAAANDFVGKVMFTAEDAANNQTSYADIQGVVLDATDGSEDGRLRITTVIAGGNRNRLDFIAGEAVFNEDSQDIDFRVESNGNANMLFVDGGNDKVGIGTNAPAKTLHISSADNQPLRVESTDAYSGVELKDNGASTLPPLISGLSDGFKIYAGHGSSRPEVMSIDATGAVTMPLQPAFQLNRQGQGNQTISANSDTTIVLATERFDRNADCASNTFTAPVTGLYKLQAFFYLKDIDTDMNYIQGKITTSNKTYYFIQSTGGYDATMQYVGKNITVLADMDASDTAHIMVYYPSGSDLTVTDETHFSGHLVC